MRRSILLVLTVALAVMVFAPIAAAKGDDGGFDDRGTHVRGIDDGGFDDRGIHARGVDDRGFDDRGTDDRGVDDNATASPASNASASATSAMSSASASATTSAASPSASPSASPTTSPTATAAATPTLPDTGGGFTPALALGPLAMIVGGGLVALGIKRRR